MTVGFYVRIANAISVLGGLADFRAYNSSQRSKIVFLLQLLKTDTTTISSKHENYQAF